MAAVAAGCDISLQTITTARQQIGAAAADDKVTRILQDSQGDDEPEKPKTQRELDEEEDAKFEIWRSENKGTRPARRK